MGSRFKEEKPFAFYDPERDREGQRQAPRNRPAPLSPRAQPSGPSYPMSTSPREQPFGHYDPDLDRDRDRHGTSYGPELRASPSRLDSRPGVGRGAPPPYINQDSGPSPMSHGYGRGAPEPASYAGRGAPEPARYDGRGAPEPASYAGRGAPEPASYAGRGAPEPASYAGRGAPEPARYDGRGAPEPASYAGRGAPEPGYGGRGAPEPAGYPGRGAPEPGYGGRGAYPPPPSNQDFAGASGRGRGYGEGEPGYARPGRPGQMEDDLGRGAPLGGGRYVYGGLQQQPERAGFEHEYGSHPAPIGSEYAHQVYASVFSDPVYGGAGQVNARAGYSEEPRDTQRVHHTEDVLRHPDQF